MLRHSHLLLLALALPACGLFDDPPKDKDTGSDALDDTGDTPAVPGEGALRGSWPHAATGRPEGVRPPLSLGWRVSDNAAPGTGTGFTGAPCAGACDDGSRAGRCGIAFELAEDRRIVDLQVALGPEDSIFLNVVEGPDAQNLEDPRGHRSLLLRAVATDDLLGRDALTPDLVDVAQRIGLTTGDDLALLGRDLMVVEHPDGLALVVVGQLFRRQAAASWSVRDVALGLDPLTGRVRFTLSLPPEVFTINRPAAPSYQAFGARLLSDGRLLMWRDGFVEPAGRIFLGALPSDGEHVELGPVALEEEGFPFSVAMVEIDREDRLYVVGEERVTYPACGSDQPPRARARLRVFAPPAAGSASLDARLLHDEGGVARSFEAITGLFVARAGSVDAPRLQVFVSGRAWPSIACHDAIHHFPKSPTEFSDDEDDLTACPERLRAECARGPCACSGCQGLQQLCPPPIFGPGPPDLVYLATFEGRAGDVASLTPIGQRAFVVPADGVIATDGGDRALVAGRALSLLDLADDSDAPVIWTLPSWGTHEGLADFAPTSLHGNWQTPMFSDDGALFSSGFLTTRTTAEIVGGNIVNHVLQRGGIVTGTLAPGEAPAARTIARERSDPSSLVAYGESDRVLPLASGRMLHVFSWRGPAPRSEESPALDRRLELRLLLPVDPPTNPPTNPPIWEAARDLVPAAGDPIPVVARCAGTRREDLDACAVPLSLSVREADVSRDAAGQPTPPREVSCQERARDGAPLPGCDVATLTARWEDSQTATLTAASSGEVTVRCSAPSVRRESLEEQAVQLFVGCPTFVERFHPFTAAALLTLDHGRHVCADDPLPLRAVFSRVAFDVAMTDEGGSPVVEGEVGVVIVLAIDDQSGEGASATYTIVSGAGTLDGQGHEITVPAGQPVDLEPTGEGVIMVRVRLYDADGQLVGEQVIAIPIEGASGCTGSDDGTVFRPCHPRLPHAPPPPDAYEARTAPATAAIGVLLHDRSLAVTELDAEDDAGMPLAIARSYRSAQREDGDGLMGGWHFALDQRLSPVTEADRAGAAPDPTWLLDEDLGAGAVFDVAIADGGGRVDTWRHPGTSEVVDFGAGPAWWVWDGAAGAAVRRAFRARVTTYEAPVDDLGALRSYTLLLEPGQSAHEVHPYWHADRAFRPNERRFYELSQPDGLRRIFDCKGRLVLIIDPQLREIELIYGGPAHPLTRTRRLSAVIDGAGRRWSIDWEVVGDYPRIAGVTDPFGRVIEYGYTATTAGDVRLTRVTRRAEGAAPELAVTRVTRYRYDAAGRLVGVIDERDGQDVPRLEVTWDGDRVARQVVGREPDEAEIWLLGGGGDEVSVSDGRGTTRTFTLRTVPGGPRVVASESHERMILDESAPLSRREVPAVALTSWTHDARGLVVTMTSPMGRVTTLEYDARGFMTEQTETGSDGASTTAQWRYENPNGALAPGFACWVLFSETSVGGATTSYSLPPFDGAAPGRACQPAQIGLPAGRLLSGSTTNRRLELDYVASGPHRGAQATRRLLEDGSPMVTQTWTYPGSRGVGPAHAGKLAEPWVGLPLSLSEEVPRPTQCSFDTLTLAETTFERDERGNVTRSSIARRGTPYVVDKTWDAFDRVVKTVVDPAGFAHATTARYDHHDRVIEERQRVVDDDPLALLETPAAPREIVRRTYYDAAGRRVATAVDGVDAHAFELFAHDDAGGLVAVLGPGAGASAADVRAVVEQLAAGTPAIELLRARDPRSAGAANYTSQAPAGSPVTPALDPRWVGRFIRLDADGLPARVETTGGRAAEIGCVGCDAMYALVEVSHRDLEGRLRVFDPGRTDRGDGATRVLVEHRYDGLSRLTVKNLVDPAGCAGAESIVRSERMSDHDAFGNPRLVEIRGASGHGDGCELDALLARVETTHDGSGKLIERKEHRLAVQPALAPTTGVRTTRLEWDHAGRLRGRVTLGGDGTPGRRDSTRYGLADVACWSASGPEDGSGYAWEIDKGTDQLGLAAYEVERHHGADGTVTVQRAFEYDALGRMLRARDGFFQVRREMAWDSLGRLRAERDVRGAIHESRYDGLGQLVAARTLLARGSRETRLTRRAGLVVAEVSEAVHDGVTHPLGRRAWRYDAMARAAVAFPRGTEAPGEAVVHAFGAAQEPLVTRAASGVVLRHALDAHGNIERADATFPSAAASAATGWSIPAGHDFLRTAARSFRYDGLGRLTDASTFATDGRRLTRLRRHWDSLDGVVRDQQDLEAASGVTQAVDTRARYDDRGRPTRVESDASRADPGAVEYAFDAVDRLVEARAASDRVGKTGIWEHAHPERIAWGWTGTMIARREVVAASTFNPAAGSTWVTAAAHDELGARYRQTHARVVGGVEQTFHEHRRWYWSGDPVVEKSVVFQGGVEQGDLGGALAALPTLGVSQLVSRPPAALFGVPADVDSWDDNAWDSRYEAREYDDEGLVQRAVTLRYAPESGAPSLSGTWSERIGGRVAETSTMLYDPDADKALEVKHASFTWSSDGSRIARATHRLARRAAAPFGPPAITEGTLAGVADERVDRLGFAYGGESQAAHDGCDLGPVGEACETEARHRFVYDPWGQLEYVAAREPDACRSPGPGADEVFPVADGLRVVHDALGRRVLERWRLPPACTGPSALPGERDRIFVHHGDTLIEERVLPGSVGVEEGVIRRVPGPEGVAWLAVRFGDAHRGHLVVFGDADGALVGLYDLSNQRFVQPGSPAPWFRAHAMVALDPSTSIAVRLVTTSGMEHQPMAKLAFVPESGYALDLHGNPLADRWYATRHASEGFFESIVHKVLFALDVLAFVTAWVPVVGDVIGFVADMGRIAWDLLQDGPSFALAGRALMAVGVAGVGLVSNLGGPPAWGAKTAVRARAVARVADAVDAGVDAARAASGAADIGQATRAVEAAASASSAARASEGAGDVARAFPEPGYRYWFDDARQRAADPAYIAGKRAEGEAVSKQFQGALAALFQSARRHLAQAPLPPHQRRVFDQRFWGGITGRDACGPTAVAMILSDFGINVGSLALRRLLSAALGHVGAGTNQANIVRALHTMGFTRSAFVVGQNGTEAARAAARASHAGNHVIASVRVFDDAGRYAGLHWVVIDRVVPASATRPGYARVRDPGGWYSTYTLEQLARIAAGPVIAVAR
ncbi:MAG: RHS repeat protein [Deltaproteobacteria bacterium]|nr:RHS repeat protein [Deltaproteobacteria bacterium]